MKRKAASSIERAELDACAPAEGNQAPEDAGIRYDAEEGAWHVTMSQAAQLFCSGCFHLTVTSGTLSMRGSLLTTSDGTVPIASYSGTSCFKLQVRARGEGVPLVLSRVASASFSLKAISRDCAVVADARHLAGVTQEPEEAIEAWEQAIEALVEGSKTPPRVLICGPKKTGKSSLARRVINGLLEHHDSVTLLEADCGQPQFGPPGFVSMTTVCEPLLLPPHCLLRQPDDSMSIGDVSAESNPITYINTIRKLLERHYGGPASGAQRSPPPLVINTMGWVKGFGLSLLRDVAVAASPSHLFSLCSGNPRKDVATSSPWMLEVAEQCGIHCMELPCIGAVAAANPSGGMHDMHARESPGGRQLPKPQSHSATDDRNSRLHAWMLATLQARQPHLHTPDTLLATAFSGRMADTAALLCACPPVVLHLADVKVLPRFPTSALQPDVQGQLRSLSIVRYQVIPMFEGWSRHNTTAVLNGSLVALVAEGELPQTAQSGLSMQEAIVNNPPRCCGLGLIHAVAPSPSNKHAASNPAVFHGSPGDAGMAYIHTPVSLERMQTVVALVVGMLEVPAAVMRAPGMCSPYVGLNCLASDAGGGGVMRSRRNLERAGQA